MKNYTKKPTFWNVCLLIIMVTFIGFGGGNAMMPVIKRYVVDKYQWLDNDEFDRNVVVTNMLPGPMAIQSLTYIAIRALGTFKGILAVVFASMPHVALTISLIFVANLVPRDYLIVVQTGVLVAITGSLIGFAWNYFKKGIKETKVSLWIILFLITLAFSVFVPTPYNIPVAIMFLIIAIYSIIFLVKRKQERKLKATPIQKEEEK